MICYILLNYNAHDITFTCVENIRKQPGKKNYYSR